MANFHRHLLFSEAKVLNISWTCGAIVQHNFQEIHPCGDPRRTYLPVLNRCYIMYGSVKGKGHRGLFLSKLCINDCQNCGFGGLFEDILKI